MNTFLYAYIILFPGKLSPLFIILIESMNKIKCFLGHSFTFFLGRLCKYSLFFCFYLLADRIKYSETPKYSEQYFCDQKSGTKVNICNFSVFEVVPDFFFIAACSLSSSSALFLVFLSYIGGGSRFELTHCDLGNTINCSFFTIQFFLPTQKIIPKVSVF